VTRPIECEQVLDYTQGKVIIRRGDTMETIDERAMTEDERQVSFFEGEVSLPDDVQFKEVGED
jgi:HSP20 family molecular chaperone IbpA